jgi:hypothetical protein
MHNRRMLFFVWLIAVGLLAGYAIGWGANQPHFWLWWEGGALFITTAYTAIFYIGLFVRHAADGRLLYQGIESFIALVPLFCILAVILLAFSTTVSMLEASHEAWFAQFLCAWITNTPMIPLTFLVGAAMCFCIVDFIFLHKHTDQAIKREFHVALLYNGLPVLSAFLLLLIFVWKFEESPQWSDVLRSFIGGAVAFETLFANTLFAILFFEEQSR